jgi:hypothetical protein
LVIDPASTGYLPGGAWKLHLGGFHGADYRFTIHVAVGLHQVDQSCLT